MFGFRRVAIFILGVVGVAGWIRADIITLKDGTKLQGDVKRSGDAWVITDAAGKQTRVAGDQVQGIEINKSGTPNAAADRLASLRRSVDNASDLKDIIARYQRFIETNPSTPAAKDAAADMAVWQDRLDHGLVKAAGRWVTIEERDQVQAHALEQVLTARDLVAQARNKEADVVLTQALKDDPQSAPAWYLRGVVLLSAEQLPQSRKAFETVNTLMPDHAPTLNNLAVIAGRQNQSGAQMAFYSQAMAAAPVNKFILDNVIEALNRLTPEQRSSNPAKKVDTLFRDQDAQLQQRMGTSGWFRWGSNWVNQKQMDDLRAAQKRIDDQVQTLTTQFNQAQLRVNNLDASINDAIQRMRSMEATSYTKDVNGALVQSPLPPIYYDLQSDIAKMDADKTTYLRQLDDLRAAAKQVKQQVPVPQFTGIQRPVGAEGTPLPAPSIPSTSQPAGVALPPLVVPPAVPEVKPPGR